MTDLFDKPLGGEGEGWSPGRKRHDNFEVTEEALGRFNCQGEYKLPPQPAFDVRLAEAWLRGYGQGYQAQLATARADALREAAETARREVECCPSCACVERHILALIDKEPINDGS